MKKSKILISGVSGFLGYHLVNSLSSDHDIIGLYNDFIKLSQS